MRHDTYGHVMREFEGGERLPAEAPIMMAREPVAMAGPKVRTSRSADSLATHLRREVRIRADANATIEAVLMTTIACVSDLHEHLVDIPACDLLLIAGDVSFAFKGDLREKHAFLAGPFREWLERAVHDGRRTQRIAVLDDVRGL